MDYETNSYDRLAAILDLAGVELRASEIHGMICGEICRQLKLGHDIDFPALMGMQDPAREGVRAARNAVDQLMDETRGELDEGVGFTLLLPGDDESMEERAGALADWTRGFSTALLRGENILMSDFEGDSAEILQDFLKISEAHAVDGSEENEKALAEIEEYVRVGVQLVFEESRQAWQPGGDPGQANRSVH